MSNQRLNQLMKKTEVHYAEGSPLLLEACALYLDTETNNCIAQFKWKNIDQRPIKAVMIELDCFDAFEQKLEPINYQYDGLLVTQGADFGGKTPIIIPNNKAVKCDVLLKAVSFSDETVWRADSLTPYIPLPNAKEQSLDGELLDQFKRDLAKKGIRTTANYDPQSSVGLWQCGCGSWQYEGSPCLKCKTTREELANLANQSNLEKHLEEYKEEQERLRIEAEKRAEEERIAREKEEEERRIQEEQDRIAEEEFRREEEAIELAFRKKRKKILIVTASIMLLLVGAYFAVQYYFIPKSKYDNAVKLMEAGKYQEAYTAFSNLGSFSDSSTRMSQVQANYYFSVGAYDEVGNIYSTLDPKYQDHVNDFTTMYSDAVTKMNAGSFDEAIDAFTKLGNYSDSKTKIQEATYLKAAALAKQGERSTAIALYQGLNQYQDSWSLGVQLQADELFDNGNYADAWEYYNALDQKYQTHNSEYASMYTAAEQLRSEGKYTEAIYAFMSLGTYSDSALQIQETHYQDAISKYKAGNYDEAADILTTLEYKDSATIIQQISADKLFDAKDYAGAWDIYATLDEAYQTHNTDYADMYSSAVQLRNDGKYDESIASFEALGSYSDSANQILESKYSKAVSLASSGKFDDAKSLFDALSGYSDSKSLSIKATADKLYESGDLAGAYDVYTTLDEKYQTHSADYSSIYASAEEKRNAGDFDGAYDLFISLGNYSDAKAKAAQCGKDKADGLFAAAKYAEASEVYTFIQDPEKAKLSTYKYAEQLASSGDYLNAARQFMTISDYEDSREKHYQMGETAFQNNQLSEAYEIFTEDIEFKDAKEQVYQVGVSASSSKQYEISVKAFTAVGAYKDAAMNLTMDTYAYGEQLHDAGKYDEAVTVFESMNGFSNTVEKAHISAYAAATRELNNGNYEDAISRFKALGNYSDSATMVQESTFQWAESLFSAGDYEQAKTLFESLGKYSTSETRLKAVKYAIAKAQYDSGDYWSARYGFKEISDYEDAAAQELASRYGLYNAYYDTGMYDQAIAGFEDIAKIDYLDSATLAKKSHYAKAKQLDESDPRAAFDEFVLAGDYSDAGTLVKTHAYDIARSYQEANNYTESISWYEIASDYSDAKEQLYKIASFYFSTQDYTMSLDAFKTLRDYKDSAGYLLRIGNYFEMQSDAVHAYLAYGYASYDGENTDKINKFKGVISSEAENDLADGKLEEARKLYVTLAAIDASFGENLNAIDFITFVQNCKTITIGNTKWKYLAYEKGKLVFIANTVLATAKYSSYNSKDVVVSTWLSSAPSKYFNDTERKLVSLWIPSSSEIKEYMPNASDRKTTGATYIWCSDKDSSYSSRYKYYEASTGDIPSYVSSSKGGSSQQNGMRPGMRLSYNSSVYHLLTSDPSRYSFQGQDGKDVVFEPKYQSNGTSENIEEKTQEEKPSDNSKGAENTPPIPQKDEGLKASYASYMAADLDSEVIVETYVQATQSWWDNKIVVYAQSPDGAYFIYNMACSEADAAKLIPGTPIRVSGYKGEWAGEVEIIDATFEFLEAEPYIATPRDVTDLLGKNELESHQNELVSFKGMTVVAQDDGNAFSYKNTTEKTDDLYYTVSKDGKTYNFCVEFYLYGSDTEVYKSVENLQVGDVVDIDAFLYWYNGPNPHSVKVTKTSKATSDTSSTESSDETRNVNGWYVSNDGKYAIKPSNLRKSYNGYLVSIQIREEASKSIILEDSVTITPEDSIPSLIPDKAIQEFVHEGNGKYSFKIACDIKFSDSAYANVTGITFTQGFSFTVN